MPRRRRSPRPTWHCLRCGHDWVGNSLAHPPARCLRCRSFYWDREPEKLANARKPTDPPNPTWTATVKTPKRAASVTPRRPYKRAPSLVASPLPAGLTPPPQLADFTGAPSNGDRPRDRMNEGFPPPPMPPPRYDEPAPESFARPEPEPAVDARTEQLVDNVLAALAEPPEPDAALAAEADLRESEYIEEAT
jgi:hypothetical protein